MTDAHAHAEHEPTEEEKQAEYDEFMGVVLTRLIHLLNYEMGICQHGIVLALLNCAGRLCCDQKKIAEDFRTTSNIIIKTLIKRGDLQWAN